MTVKPHFRRCSTASNDPGYSRFAVFRHASVVYVLTLGTKPTLAASYSPALDTVPRYAV